ncbi:MAG: DNA/RNA nuclease SfsA [candidate division WOR-3 bacterium]
MNRFTVECKLNNKRIKAYLPNPGRLWEILIPGKIIYLKRIKNKFKVWAAERNGNIICLDTHYTNNVAREILKKGIIYEFKDYEIKEEVKIENHRIDFVLKKGKEILPLEVKSCTLLSGEIAMFPDAITLRGKKHLEILAENNGAILFIVHHPDVKYFLPDFHTDPLFSETLWRLRMKIIIKAISIKWNKNENFEFIRELKIPWHVYEKEGKDKGSYIIYGELKRSISLKIGGLGEIFFKKGHYLYIGSSMNSLSSRIKRHLRKKKKLRWHIDYLIHYLENIKPIPIRASEFLECSISKEIEKISDGFIKNFGSSDCRCKSHLYFLKENPFKDEKFLNILLKYRIDRLRKFI